MDPDVTSAIRDIFVMVVAGVFSALGLVLIIVIVKLYRPLRDTVHNAAKATEDMSGIAGHVVGVSEETAQNILQTSRNAVEISQGLKEGSEELPGTVRSAGEAAGNVAAAASTVGAIAETISRFSSLGVTGGGPSGVGGMLRLLRTLFGGGRKSDDSGVQQA